MKVDQYVDERLPAEQRDQAGSRQNDEQPVLLNQPNQHAQHDRKIEDYEHPAGEQAELLTHHREDIVRMRFGQAHLLRAKSETRSGPATTHQCPVGKIHVIESRATAQKGVDAMPGIVVKGIGQNHGAKAETRHDGNPLHRQAREQDQYEPASREQDGRSEVRLCHQQDDDQAQQSR